MRVWLQDDSRKTKYAGQTVTIDNFKLITQSPQAGELTFYDKTTGDPSLGAGWATKTIVQSGLTRLAKASMKSFQRIRAVTILLSSVQTIQIILTQQLPSTAVNQP